MKKINKPTLPTVLRCLPLLLCFVAIITYFLSKDDISLDAIINRAPEQPGLAALFLIIVYIIQSLTIFFPVILLYLAGGYIFGPPVGMLVNTAGMTGALLLQYCIGRFSGKSATEKILRKYPKAAPFIKAQSGNGFMVSFFMRLNVILPSDLVSMYLGAVNVPILPFLTGSLAGLLPGIIASTLLGTSITDPDSPLFVISAAAVTVLTVISSIGYYKFIKRKAQKTGR